MTKTCSHCDRQLPAESFVKNRARYDGLQVYCRECGAEYSLRHRYGLTPASYAAMLEAQNFGCLVCGREDRLHVDHDHARPGTTRAILCAPCNQALGLMNSSSDRLKGLALYAELYCSPSVQSGVAASALASSDVPHPTP